VIPLYESYYQEVVGGGAATRARAVSNP